MIEEINNVITLDEAEVRIIKATLSAYREMHNQINVSQLSKESLQVWLDIDMGGKISLSILDEKLEALNVRDGD